MRFWLFICRVSAWLYLRLGLYGAWSRTYRAMFERSYDAMQLYTFSNLQEVGAYLNAKAHLWRADSWKQLFDAVSRPERTQAFFDGREVPHDGLDCDEYAIWTVNSIHRSLMQGKMAANEHVSAPRMLTVTWLEGWKPQGHNVCLVKTAAKWAYLDYGPVRGHTNAPEGVVQAVLTQYGAANAVVIGWAEHDHNMKHLATHWGLT